MEKTGLTETWISSLVDFLVSNVGGIGIAALVVAILGAPLVSLSRKRTKELKAALNEIQLLRKAVAPQHTDSETQQDDYGPDSDYFKADSDYVFISYVEQDSRYVDDVLTHLRPLLRRFNLVPWMGSVAGEGTRSSAQLKMMVENSILAVILVSPDYLASEFIQGLELPAIVNAEKNKKLQILWLPIRPSVVESTELANYQALLNPGNPLSTLDPKAVETALVRVAESFERTLSQPGFREGDTELASTNIDAWRLVRISVENIRCFEQITIDLAISQGNKTNISSSLRTVLVGDNATGKSTLLRSIALGMCDESGAAALLQDMSGEFIRTNAGKGVIELTFQQEKSDKKSTSRTEISRSKSGAEIVRKSGDFPGNQLIVAYGTQRTRSGTRSLEKYNTTTAVSTLFDDEASLQNPELVLLRQPRWIRNEMMDLMAGILDLEKENLEFVEEGVRVIGPWGSEKLEALSDGYRSTSQWLLDFVNWLIFFSPNSQPAEVGAIVLIDELEQHLHPQWQRKIISRFRKHLPRVQFFMTSHSPLIASSITRLDESGWREKLIYLGRDESGHIQATESEILGGMSVEQVLASPAFDYLIEAEPSVAAVFEEASRLASKGAKRDQEEETRYQEVKEIVGEILQKQDRTLVEREAREDIQKKTAAEIKELESIVFKESK